MGDRWIDDDPDDDDASVASYGDEPNRTGVACLLALGLVVWGVAVTVGIVMVAR